MAKKKKYKNYSKNQSLRRYNRNIRKIRDGKVITIWKESE